MICLMPVQGEDFLRHFDLLIDYRERQLSSRLFLCKQARDRLPPFAHLG